MKQRKQNSPAFRFADTKSAMLQPPGRGLSARSLVSAPPGKVTLAPAARLPVPFRVVNALPTPPLRYQLFPGVGYFHFMLFLLPRLVRLENRFKSPLRSGAGTKFISFRSSKRGPSTPFPCPRFSEKSPACFACSVVNALTTAQLR